jgi:dimethylamine/trimethylamine dehydrogenase
MRLNRHDILFEPLQIGTKVFRNRFYSVPHASFHPGRRLSDIAFRRTKAEGGWAAVCGGVVSIRPDSWGGFVPRLWDDEDRAFLGRLAAEVRDQGALAGIELGHAGARGDGAKFEPSLGASQVRDTARGGWVPKAMDLDDIRRLQDEWVAAAITAADLGYDIVYAYGAHGMLPAQFLSPYFNRRTDGYGGTLDHRARFWLEMIERFRAAIGDRCLIAARIAAENFTRIGVSAEETLEFIRMADDLVDLWDVNVGHLWARDSAAWRVASEGYQVEWSGRVRSVTAKPIVGVGRLTTPDAMVDVLRSGVWDFVGGARPGIADPFLPRKIEEGRYDEIRECTGGNFCISVETTGNGLTCVQNSTIGEEYRRGWHPEQFAVVGDRTLNVLVVGAGPAGLECARVLGERGVHSVHVVDAGEAVGGHLRWLRAIPGAEGFGRVVDYRATRLGRLDNVTVILNRRLDARDAEAYGADVVVVATGSHWIGTESDLHGFPLAELEAHGLATFTPEAVMIDGRRPTGAVAVWDADGGAVGVGLADKLAVAGARVTLLTPFDVVGASLDPSLDGWKARRRLHELGVAMGPGRTPAVYSDGELTVRDQFGDESVVEASALIVVSQRVSDDALYHELVAAGMGDVLRVGDCLAPRPLGFTVADGHRLAREIDGPTPGIPLLPRVERDADAPTASFASVIVGPVRSRIS